ncbi:MAG: FHA domain-containing protein [Verrucomicrobia bacterium]|nr:FHA domain-containing protein [Verrucomicrobiota bacterium]
MAALVIESGSRQGAVLELAPGIHVLGRSDACQQRFEDATVSGRHCEVRVSPMGVHVRDLGSSNGITVDGRPVQEAELLDGQRLGLGDVILRAVIPPVPISIPTLSEPEPTGPSLLSNGTPRLPSSSRRARRVPVRTLCPDFLYGVRASDRVVRRPTADALPGLQQRLPPVGWNRGRRHGGFVAGAPVACGPQGL